MQLSAQLAVAGDDLLQRCKTVQEVLLRDPKLDVLMDVGPETEKKHFGKKSQLKPQMNHLPCRGLSICKGLSTLV